MVDDFYKYKKKEGTWIREVIPQSHTWMGFVICLVLSREGRLWWYMLESAVCIVMTCGQSRASKIAVRCGYKSQSSTMIELSKPMVKAPTGARARPHNFAFEPNVNAP
jgi:hypothetical protein